MVVHVSDQISFFTDGLSIIHLPTQEVQALSSKFFLQRVVQVFNSKIFTQRVVQALGSKFLPHRVVQALGSKLKDLPTKINFNLGCQSIRLKDLSKPGCPNLKLDDYPTDL